MLTGKKEHVCTACAKVIKIGEDYWGTSFNAFCKECGEKKINGELVYESKSHRYVEASIKKTSKCQYCTEMADNYIKGTPTCDNCIGKAMEGMY